MSSTQNLELGVEVEQPSPIMRKLTIKVPALRVKRHIEKGLAAVQKTAEVKGFRVGYVPIAIVKARYDESLDEVVKQKDFRILGQPQIDTPENKTGAGAHDHVLHEDRDLTFTATFEVMPEVKVQGYTGLSVNQEKVEITDTDVDKVIQNLLESQAQLEPVQGGLALEDGTASSRPSQKGDFLDAEIEAKKVSATGELEALPEFSGSRMIEIGLDSFLPGFDDQVTGVRQSESKTFRLDLPADFQEPKFASAVIEFSVKVNGLKTKKLPTLDDSFAKQVGYESVDDLKVKGRDFLTKERSDESKRKLQGEILGKIIEKNQFDVPAVLVETQTRALAQDWAQELKKQGYDEKLIKAIVTQELESLKKRAEGQVRVSLILEAIAKEESISVTQDEVKGEIANLSTGMNVDAVELQDFYEKNSSRKDDLEFRMRQERTIQFLIDQSKVNLIAPVVNA
jgi:trigger factor